MDSTIKVLSPQLSNMIAAGEVVQRPASVVKELVENAIDAGATKIQVVVVDAGRTLIQVVDNGKGMTKEEAQICFERHATSKLAGPDDLHNILTFGFRGEALPSIAAVSKVTLKTRPQDAELGSQVAIAAGEQTDCSDVACPQGTNILVRDLFYNIPARRKFLKSDNIELRHIIEEFVKIALRSTDKALSLTADEKVIYDLRPAISLKARIRDISGESSTDNLMELTSESDIIKIWGFVGTPDSARKTGNRQYFFANGRYFRSPYFHKAIMQAYEGLIGEGTQPSYYLFYEVDPAKVDVNIHPSKIEIKFEEESLIYNILNAAVRQSIGMGALSSTIDFSLDAGIQMPTIDAAFQSSTPREPQVTSRQGYNPFDYERRQDYSALFGEPQAAYAGRTAGTFASDDVSESTATAAAGQPHADLATPAPLADTTADAQTPLVFSAGSQFALVHNDKLLVVNTLGAYRRVFYEEYMDVLQARGVETSPLLFPLIISLGKEELLNVKNYQNELGRIGVEAYFDVESGYVEVSSKPAALTESALRDLVELLSLDAQANLSEEYLSKIALKMAASSAQRAFNSAKMSVGGFKPAQAQDLFKNLCATSAPMQDPEGSRIITEIN